MNSLILLGYDASLALEAFDYPVIDLLSKWHGRYDGWDRGNSFSLGIPAVSAER